MTPIQEFAKKIIVDCLTSPLMTAFDSREARVLLGGIGFQESRFEYRKQVGGPAHGFWQFERGGGVNGALHAHHVLIHAATEPHAAAVCAYRGVSPDAESVYQAIVDDDYLACAFARLLLWSDPDPLPPINDVRAGWNYYVNNWRPGKPKLASWPAMYARAMETFP